MTEAARSLAPLEQGNHSLSYQGLDCGDVGYRSSPVLSSQRFSS